MTKRNRGTTLIELLVALPLVAVLGAAAVMLLLQAHRLVRHADSLTAANRELRHAVAAIASDLRPLRAVDLVAWSDTSVEFDAMVGAGIVCEGRGSLRQVDLLPVTDDDAARTNWNTPPQPGDVLHLWLSTGLSAIPESATARLTGVARVRACTLAPQLQNTTAPAALAQRLQLSVPLLRAPQLGSPVRVVRRVRLATYKGGDGAWYVGRSTWSGGAWDVIQPIAGPVLSPSRGGLRLTVRDSVGRVIASGSAGAAQLHIELRAARRAPSIDRSGTRTITDSTAADVTLRGDRGGDLGV